MKSLARKGDQLITKDDETSKGNSGNSESSLDSSDESKQKNACSSHPVDQFV